MLGLRDVGALEPSEFGKPLLSEASLVAQLLEPSAEINEFWLLFPHGTSIEGLGPRVYGSQAKLPMGNVY